MRAGGVCAAAAAMLLAGSGAAAQTVVDPDWAVKPDGKAMAEAFPPLAKALGIAGYASIACDVTVAGVLADCTVISEAPRGLGFGPAALSLAPGMTFTPKQVDGQAVDGGVVRLPIRFSLPEPDLLPAKPAPASPGALDAARRMLAPDLTASLTERYAASTKTLESEPAPGVEAGAQRRGVESIRLAARAVIPAWVDAVALTYASLVPEDQLAADLAFRQSAAGQAYKAHTPEIRAAYGVAGDRAQRAAGAEILKLWCARQAAPCPPPSAATADPTASATKPASPKAMATARSIVAADGVPAGFARTSAMFTPQALNLPQVDAAAQAIIAQGARATFDAEAARALEDMAALHASLFSEAELAEILAFKSSPVAATMRAKEADLYKAQMAISAGYAHQVSARAGALYCKQADCNATAKAPAAHASAPARPKPVPVKAEAEAPASAPISAPAPPPTTASAPAPKASKTFVPTPRKKPLSSR